MASRRLSLKLSLFISLSFVCARLYANPASETENFLFTISSYLRQDLVNFKNVADLESANSDDTTTYLGIDYNLGFNLEHKNGGPKFYLKLERNGPYDYSAPLFVHNTLMNTGGVIEEYRNDELLPQLEEFWVDTPLLSPVRFKLGLYTYEVGNCFSLNGSYENYGFTFYHEADGLSWRIYYCRPDLVYKNHLGPRIRQDEEQGIDYNHSVANFFAADAQFEAGKNSFWPYIGVLTDHTSLENRDSIFSAPVKEDTLGTAGISWNFKEKRWSYCLEMAHNFGKGKSSEPEFKDVYHTGYLIYSHLDYTVKKWNPYFKFLFSSGNKATPEMALEGLETLPGGKDRAFSYASALNRNLTDSVSSSNSDILPIVAMSGGYGLQYGIPRPRTFSSGDFENLILPCLGFNFYANRKLTLSVDAFYLRSTEKGVGTFEGEGKYLPRDLGKELDLVIDYQLNEHTLISFLGGYFFPGKYYREQRDDTGGSILTSFVRGDGEADNAYEVDIAVELKF